MKQLFILISLLLWSTDYCLGDYTHGNWEYKYDVISPGTRSEEVSGHLCFKGTELNKSFDHVITPLGEFAFDNTGLSEKPIGWLPVSKYSNGRVEVARTRKEVDQLLNGKVPWFRSAFNTNPLTIFSPEPTVAGTFEKPPGNVGANWFYLVNRGLWINPDKIENISKGAPPK
jgi:hypothetical protein